MRTSEECISWFENQCEQKRRILQIIVLVPNSDNCAYFVQEWDKSSQVWKEIGDGYSLREAISQAIDREEDKA